MILQVGVKALIKNRDNQYLFLQRETKLSTDSNEISWDIPGGRINPDESLFEGLKREVIEETGCVITSSPRLIAAQDIFVPTKEIHVVRLTYVLEENIADVILSEEHVDYKWIHESKVTSLNAEPFLAEVLKNLK